MAASADGVPPQLNLLRLELLFKLEPQLWLELLRNRCSDTQVLQFSRNRLFGYCDFTDAVGDGDLPAQGYSSEAITSG
jgi:hypothetical protein